MDNKMSKISIPTVTLNNGLKMPVVGYGTWLGPQPSIDGTDLIFDTAELPQMMEAISYAIDIGYRHIDTAHLYRVEPEVGQVVHQKIQEGVIKREDIVITTKVWQHYHRPAAVEQSVMGSLRRLGMDYVDLLLMHWPMAISQDGVDEKIDYIETWRGFESVLSKGLAKAIGVSNFNMEQMKRLLANCKIPPAANEVEINLNLGQNDLVRYCQMNNVAVIAFSPFGTMMPSRDVQDSPEPKLDNPTMVKIGKKYGKTVTQVTLRYLYQRGILSIPKSITRSRVLENASIFDFELDNTDMETIAKFDNGYRSVRPVFWQNYDNYPFDKVKVDKMEIPLALRKWKNGANSDIE